jgi:hypothetical protein
MNGVLSYSAYLQLILLIITDAQCRHYLGRVDKNCGDHGRGAGDTWDDHHRPEAGKRDELSTVHPLAPSRQAAGHRRHLRREGE